MSETTAVARHQRGNVVLGKQGLEFDLDSMIRFANGLVDAGMAPKGVSKPGAVVGLLEAGRELGLAPMYALSNLTFTNGRLGIMGDAAKALVRARGVLKPGTDFEAIYEGDENTPSWTCTVTAWRDGQPKPFSCSFSIQDAITAGLVRIWQGKVQSKTRDGWGDSGPWATYTQRMLMYRALGFLCRDRFSDVLGGAVLTEELRDYPTTDHRAESAPAGPDPLLAQAEEAVIIAEEPIQATLPAPAATVEAPDGITDEEQRTIAAIEKLEGAMITATSKEALDLAWSNAAPLIESLSVKQRKALSKLYDQAAESFTSEVTR